MTTRRAEGEDVPGTDAELQNRVWLRRFPYPYRAMLAICSDLDETPDRQVYFETARFLNTTENTAMGRGVGLEVGNTIYFDMPANQFSYWNTDDTGRAMARALIQSGHIDCLHSFGDLARTRTHAARALDELVRSDCRLAVWIDHAVAPTNFGSDIMQGSGDVPGAEAYHADLSCEFGIQYVWRGRVTSIIGQDVRRDLSGIFSGRHPLASLETLGKEWVKGVVGRSKAKYAMHGPNRVLAETCLRDGRKVLEFLRCNPHWGGVSCGETATGLPDVLTDRMLRTLIGRQGVCVLYTHLGKITNRQQPLDLRAQNAFRRLAQYASQGDVLVTTTRRLLGYCSAVRALNYEVFQGDGITTIDVTGGASGISERDLQGLTFYVSEPERTRLSVKGQALPEIERNPADATGQASVSVPLRRLEFPSL